MYRFGKCVIAAPILQSYSNAFCLYADVTKLAVPILVVRRVGNGVIRRRLVKAALHCRLEAVGSVVGLATGLLCDLVHRGLSSAFIHHLTCESRSQRGRA